MPSNTFIGTWLAVSAVGAVPVPVEPDPRTYNIDPERLQAAITSRTRAVMPVHLYGLPADIDAISEVARAYGLAVIEDAAQAHSAEYKGRKIGSHSDLVCWSFYPGKNLGAMGDGGAVTSDRDDLADGLRLLRNYGSREKYENEVRGTNSRLDPLQAAILSTKLKYLDEWTLRRRRIAAFYTDALAGSDVELPIVPEGISPAWHLFVIRTRNRDKLRERLTVAGIETILHYPIPPHRQRAYADHNFEKYDLAIADKLAREVLSLPIGPQLARADADSVVSAVLSAGKA